MVVTADKLSRLARNLKPEQTQLYANLLSNAMERFGIDTPKRAAFFLAQCATESDYFSKFRENLNYSAARLVAVWPTRFKNVIDAGFYERQPAKLANFVYANRMGNGNEASGDGWKYRGAGWLQCTGKTNQRECAQALGVTSDIGEWLATPQGAALSAAWAWWKAGCNRYADQGNVDAVSDLINIGHVTQRIGDSIGFTTRKIITNQALLIYGEQQV